MYVPSTVEKSVNNYILNNDEAIIDLWVLLSWINIYHYI